jgi:dolichol-phosphate mannosyltransferase
MSHEAGTGAFDGTGLSLVVPFYDEGPLVAEVLSELRGCLPGAEIIAVDDGSRDDTWQRIREAAGVRGLRFARNCGQSAAILAGLRAATQPLVGIMDGDGQNDPAGFAALALAVRCGLADAACGYRAHRHDSWSRRAASRIGNRVRRMFLHDTARDTGCAMKVFRRELVDVMVPFRGLHRYLPVFFQHAGARVVELPVMHRPRSIGFSKYDNWGRARAGIRDIFGVAWLMDRKLCLPPIEEKP